MKRSIFLITILYVAFFAIFKGTFAQSWENLSEKEQLKIQRLWSKLGHTATLGRKGSSPVTGQIIFSTDSGIVWRSVPQYLPYHPDNIQLIPYQEIEWLQTLRQGRLGRHVANGAVTGAVLGTSFAYWGTYISGAFYPGEVAPVPVYGALLGATTGLLAGVVIDKIRAQRKIHAPNQKTIRRVGGLYTHKNEDFWRKQWIVNDSLIEDYSLPPNLDKLKPLYRFRKLELSGYLNRSTDLIYSLGLENGSISRFGDGYDMRPRTIEFRLSYRIKPWLKMGLLTHKTENDGKYLEIYHSDPDLFQYGSGYIKANYERTFGTYVEYIPFPVRYLAFRKWEFHLGAGIMREKGNVGLSYYLDYETIGNTYHKAGLNESYPFEHPAGLVYVGLRFFANRNLSFEVQAGKYFSKTLSFEPARLDLIEPYSDLTFQLNKLNLSRTYLSLATSVRL